MESQTSWDQLEALARHLEKSYEALLAEVFTSRERQGFMRFVRNVLLDEVPLTSTAQWAYPPLVNTFQCLPTGKPSGHREHHGPRCVPGPLR
ncbi:hypothetical protein [Myxococcus xanthus]|uniref:hypothetical protein n=1 Tax=Myxococcus xanthus TaxID=34 RepID=UPI001127AF70|nr:hypothetical protein [Myxococcus xanthus]